MQKDYLNMNPHVHLITRKHNTEFVGKKYYSLLLLLKLFIISDVKCTVKCTDVKLILDYTLYC